MGAMLPGRVGLTRRPSRGGRSHLARSLPITIGTALAIACLGCDKPGVRGTGVASAAVGAGVEWTGSCEYSVETRWSAQLRHILRLRATEGSASIVLQSRRAWSQGRRNFSEEANRTLLGLVLDEATVEGGIIGLLNVRKTSDSLIVDVSGQMAGRDTVPLVAQCRVALL